MKKSCKYGYFILLIDFDYLLLILYSFQDFIFSICQVVLDSMNGMCRVSPCKTCPIYLKRPKSHFDFHPLDQKMNSKLFLFIFGLVFGNSFMLPTRDLVRAFIRKGWCSRCTAAHRELGEVTIWKCIPKVTKTW